MVRWWSWTTADGHERIQNEAIRQKHRPGSLKHWLCRFITAAFIWTHDIKLEIREINKQDTTLLYAMFVYNARREDWIQVNDVSVFANVHTYTNLYRIKKFPLWRAFSKISRHGRKTRWIRVDASRIRKKKFAFSQISGYVRTGPKLWGTIFIFYVALRRLHWFSSAFRWDRLKTKLSPKLMVWKRVY